ncbi:hypothetical protein Tco_0320366 [Tanacetum coccineum]
MQVLNENIVEKEIMEESPEKVKDKADELIPENLYDTESEIQTVKSFYSTQISDLQDQPIIDADAIADLLLSDSELSEMPDDNLQSLLDIGLFESKSNLITKVSDDIRLTMPNLINNVLQEQLSGLLSATLKECLPTILTETLKAQVSTVSEQLAQTQTTLNKQKMKKIKKQFAIAHQTECEKFMVLQKALTNVLQLEIDQSVTKNVLDGMGEVKTDLQTQSKHLYMLSKDKEEAKIINVADSTNSDDFDTQPLSKKFKISPSIPDIIKTTPLISPSIIDIIKPTPLSLILLPELPIRDKSKGKEFAKDDSMLEITLLLEEGGSTQKTLKLSKKNNDY